MTQTVPDVLVVGGGIGGLTTALCAARRGLSVRVLEQAATYGEIGAGIQLAPNATRVLGRLGLLDRLRDVGLGVVRWGTRDLRVPQVLSARVRAAQPTGPCRAELSCGVCHASLEDCSCAPALLLPRSAREAA